MNSGVYRKIEGRTGVGLFYQFLHLARHHTTGDQFIVYIPLRVEPEWAGTVRPCILERALFEQKFEYVGEGLPENIHRGLGELADEIAATNTAAEEPATPPPLDFRVFAEALTEVIWWMLGERDDLPPVPNDFQRRKYWWRPELRERFEAAQLKAEAAAATDRPAPQETK